MNTLHNITKSTSKVAHQTPGESHRRRNHRNERADHKPWTMGHGHRSRRARRHSTSVAADADDGHAEDQLGIHLGRKDTPRGGSGARSPRGTRGRSRARARTRGAAPQTMCRAKAQCRAGQRSPTLHRPRSRLCRAWGREAGVADKGPAHGIVCVVGNRDALRHPRPEMDGEANVAKCVSEIVGVVRRVEFARHEGVKAGSPNTLGLGEACEWRAALSNPSLGSNASGHWSSVTSGSPRPRVGADEARWDLGGGGDPVDEAAGSCAGAEGPEGGVAGTSVAEASAMGTWCSPMRGCSWRGDSSFMAFLASAMTLSVSVMRVETVAGHSVAQLCASCIALRAAARSPS